jgi:ADP-ribose pyrophosphatase YjhB (NUDIX family)
VSFLVEVDRHNTVSVFLVFEGKVLLIKNPHHGIWLPPGGHVEENELFSDTAVREVKEETGLKIDLFKGKELFSDLPKVRELIKPEGVLLINVKENHQHVDFIYFAKVFSKDINPMEGESKEYKWFTKGDLLELNEKKLIQNDIKEFALRAINRIGGNK